MVVIVGAGPAGLATAYELQQRGIPYRVLEREAIGYAWLNHYDRLHLHTLKQVSALPGLPMPAHFERFPSAHSFQSYLEGYARHFKLNITCGVEVQDARWQGDHWRIQTSCETVIASVLVVATGIWSTPVIQPDAGLDDFGGTVIHANEYRNAEPFAGQHVLVVGSGNSGSEIAVDLQEHGVKTGISIRTGSTFVHHPRSPLAMRVWAWLLRNLPRSLGERLLRLVRRDFRDIGIEPPAKSLLEAYPVVGYLLPDAVAAGDITMYSGVQRFIPGGIEFMDGMTECFDSVIMATGYRPTVQFVAHEIEFDARGRPRVDASWRSVRNPHLFCVGFNYPATEGWLQAIPRVARDAASAIAATTAVSRTASSASIAP